MAWKGEKHEFLFSTHKNLKRIGAILSQIVLQFDVLKQKLTKGQKVENDLFESHKLYFPDTFQKEPCYILGGPFDLQTSASSFWRSEAVG